MRMAPFLIILAMLTVPFASAPAQGIFISSGVLFPTNVGVEYRFNSTQHFYALHVGSDHLRVDQPDLRFRSTSGILKANITQVDVDYQSSGTTVVVDWLGTADANVTTAFYNVSFLEPATTYRFYVDGVLQSNYTTGGGPAGQADVFFEWSNWTNPVHTFYIQTDLQIVGIVAGDWLMILLIFVLVMLMILGFFIPFLHILAGITALFLAYQAWTVTGSDALLILLLGFGVIVIVMGVFEET